MPDVVIDAKAIQDTFQRMLDRIDALEDMIGLGDDDVTLIMRCTGCTRKEAEIVSLLRKRRVAYTPEMLHGAIYGGLPESDQPGIKIIHVLMTKVRRKLRVVRVSIDSVYHVGYTMAEPDRLLLTSMMNALLVGQKAAA